MRFNRTVESCLHQSCPETCAERCLNVGLVFKHWDATQVGLHKACRESRPRLPLPRLNEEQRNQYSCEAHTNQHLVYSILHMPDLVRRTGLPTVWAHSASGPEGNTSRAFHVIILLYLWCVRSPEPRHRMSTQISDETWHMPSSFSGILRSSFDHKIPT